MRSKYYTILPTASSNRTQAVPSVDRSEAGGDHEDRSSGNIVYTSSDVSERDSSPGDPPAAAHTPYDLHLPDPATHAYNGGDGGDDDDGVENNHTRRSSITAPPSWAALRRRSSTTPAAAAAGGSPGSTLLESESDDAATSTINALPRRTTARTSGPFAARTSWTRRRASFVLPPPDATSGIAASSSSEQRSNTGDSSASYDEVPSMKPTMATRSTNDSTGGGGRWHDYRRVWDRYPCYRWYLLAHVCQHVGDWFVRVASLLVVERLSSTGSALAHLVWAVMLPKTLVAPLGGYLADRYDRRHLMIALDVSGAVVVLGYLVAIQKESLPLLYLTTVFRSSLTSLYYPATTGIVPLLVPNAADLQLAVTMNGWAWATMAVLGGTLAGTATAVIGLSACYVIDCATFLLSALMVYHGVAGAYRVRCSRSDSSSTAPADDGSVATIEGVALGADKVSCGVVQEVASYLTTCGFGWLVVMKASAGLVWGPEDIIGVQYATVRDPSTGQEDEDATSWRTGLLFSVIGIGMLAGPTLSNLWTNGNLPRTMQRASWIGLVCLTLGWLLISLCGSSFAGFLVCTMIRTVGSGMVWVNSTVSLQALTEPSLLGRVLSIEYTAYTLAEALSATVTGELFDAGLDKGQLALLGAAFGAVAVGAWGRYHFSGSGAAHPRFNYEPSKLDDVVSSLEVSSSILDDMTVSSTPDVELAYIKA
jgi:MFS family permease